MPLPRYLTKSRFKLACDCPTKLFYTKKKEYIDSSQGDSFMQALAEGGFQVGELAKLYFKGGHDIKSLDYEEALNETNELLQQKNVIIYEAAIKYSTLFIRVDVLVKTGDTIAFYEVKAKSARSGETFLDSKGNYISSAYKSYLYDVAFQYHVVRSAFPNHLIKPHLSLMDKDTLTSVDGLNQLFKIARDNGRTSVEINPLAETMDLGEPLLTHFDVKEICKQIYNGTHIKSDKKDSWEEIDFLERINQFAHAYANDEKINCAIGKHCSSCEFNADKQQLSEGKKSGFLECWKSQTSLSEELLDRPLVFDLWKGFMGSRDVVSPLLQQERYFLDEIKETDIIPKSGKKTDKIGMDFTDRRMLQVNYEKDKINEPFFDRTGFLEEQQTWQYPLHFIDFETSMVAIPFHANKHPYEQIAFQFSHHTIGENGNVAHAGEYLHVARGEFPNFDFVRALKKVLEGDDGTVFRYHNHENTVLNQIKSQLENSTESDKEALIDFIDTITHDKEGRVGYRDMVDMYELVINYFYHRSMQGSNSIKSVLPAVLESSKYLQDKYNQPIYGTDEIKSHNFKDKIWLHKNEAGKVISPYKELGLIFGEKDKEHIETFFSGQDELNDGGAAMTAWAYMQFSEMSTLEHERMSQALLRYCELDTLAMVMIYEYFMNG